MQLILNLCLCAVWVVGVSCDFQCICNYQSTLTVYSNASKQSTQIGALGEFECKSEIPNHFQDWFGIAFKHQVGFVESTSGMVLQQTCPGSPPTGDKVSSSLPSTTKSYTTPNTSPTSTTATTVLSTLTSTVTSTSAIPSTTPSPASTTGDIHRCSPILLQWSRDRPNRYLSVHRNQCFALDLAIQGVFDSVPAWCRTLQGTPLTISNDADQRFIQEFVKRTINKPVWIGCNGNNGVSQNYHWTVTSGTFTNWSPNVPHDAFSLMFGRYTNDCAVLDPTQGGKWSLTACASPYHVMCQCKAVRQSTSSQHHAGTAARTTPTSSITTPKASSYTRTHTQSTHFDILGHILGFIKGTTVAPNDMSRCSIQLQSWEKASPSHIGAQWGNSCYTLDTNTRKTLREVDGICRSFLGHVVDILSQQEQDFLERFLKQNGVHDIIWIGYTDFVIENNFGWTSGAKSSFVNLKPGEQHSLLHDILDCTVINPDNNGLWQTKACFEVHLFICEYDDLSKCTSGFQSWVKESPSHIAGQWGHSCYTFVTYLRLTHQQAEDGCRSYGGHAVDILSQQEQDYLQGFLRRKGIQGRMWIGYNDVAVENHFVWTSGRTPSFDNFKPGDQHSPSHASLDCAVLNPDNNGLWETRSCSENHFFICEYGDIRNCPPLVVQWSKEEPDRYLANYKNKCYAVDLKFNGPFDSITSRCFVMEGSSIVTIMDEAEQKFIEEFVRTTINLPVWIGYSGVGRMLYNFHWPILSDTYTNWYRNETQNGISMIFRLFVNNCAMLDPGQGGKWNLTACGTTMNGMCQYQTIKQSPYNQTTLPAHVTSTPTRTIHSQTTV